MIPAIGTLLLCLMVAPVQEAGLLARPGSPDAPTEVSVGGFLIALFAGWLLGRKTTQEEMETGHGVMGGYTLWRFLIRFAAPLAVGAIIVSVILGKEYQ